MKLGSGNSRTCLAHLKFEGGRLFQRRDEGWAENTCIQPKSIWGEIEQDLGSDRPIAVVVFVGAIDGEHQHRPATEEELNPPGPQPAKGILALLKKAGL